MNDGLIKLLIRKETVDETLQTEQGGGKRISKLFVMFWMVFVHGIAKEDAVHSIADKL